MLWKLFFSSCCRHSGPMDLSQCFWKYQFCTSDCVSFETTSDPQFHLKSAPPLAFTSSMNCLSWAFLICLVALWNNALLTALNNLRFFKNGNNVFYTRLNTSENFLPVPKAGKCSSWYRSHSKCYPSSSFCQKDLWRRAGVMHIANVLLLKQRIPGGINTDSAELLCHH